MAVGWEEGSWRSLGATDQTAPPFLKFVPLLSRIKIKNNEKLGKTK